MKLSEELINAHSPYHVTVMEGTCLALFTTKFDVQYVVRFDIDDTSLKTPVYQLVLTNANHRKSPGDLKVRKTVSAIVEAFLADNQEVVLYICETGDGMQAMRNRLFTYWFEKSFKRVAYITSQTCIVDEDGVENFATVVARADNPNATRVMDEFRQTTVLLNSKPRG